MKREAIGHTKIRKLALYLDCPLYVAVGLMESLWHLAARQAWRGDIGRLSDEDIALALDYRGDVSAMLAAVAKAGLIDHHPECRFVIHDWWEHSEDSVHAKVARHREVFACGRIPKLKKLTKLEHDALAAHYATVWATSSQNGILGDQNRILGSRRATKTAIWEPAIALAIALAIA